MSRFTTRHIIAAGTLATMLGGQVIAQPEVNFVPDVVAQFNALSKRPDALGFQRGASPNPTRCKHYQGIVRYQSADNTPYFLVSRSGNIPEIAGLPDDLACWNLDDDDPGNLLVVRMESRDQHGERMRSNRLRRNTETIDSAPDPVDTTVAYITFDGSDVWPHYGHPGGVDVVGDVLAVALEKPVDGFPANMIQFIDVSVPENPQYLSQFVTVDQAAGMVSITPLADGHYLMLIAGGGNEMLSFYKSLPTEDDGSTDLSSPALDWYLLDRWHLDQDGDMLGADWHTGGTSHQTLHFIREGDIDGQLYLAGARNDLPGGFGSDYIDLYRLEVIDGDYVLIHESTRHKVAHPNSDGSLTGNGASANFAAASGFYVSPTGELLFYATEHDNDGPKIGDIGTVKAGEWRHEFMVRHHSPTLNPTVITDGDSYSVPEGSSVSLSASAGQPLTRAWLQLWNHDHFGGRYVVMDYDDWNLDDFDNFKDLDGALVSSGDLGEITESGFSDLATSWRWFAPVGCTIRANDDDFGDNTFPGPETRTLVGTGDFEDEDNLEGILSDNLEHDMSDAITSAEFFPNCHDYYNTDPVVRWDANNNGDYEINGDTLNFSAASLDGPSTRTVGVAAIHPTDGRQGERTVEVQIINVAPYIIAASLGDISGQKIGADVPYALEGLPVTLNATFDDPGVLDTHTSYIIWGDGVVDGYDSYAYFQDALGTRVGQASHSHSFAAGSYQIRLNITDDDGASRVHTLNLEVVSATTALESVLAQLDALVASTSDPDQLDALQDARDFLDGVGTGQPANGALDGIDSGDLAAALVKLQAVVEALNEAEAAGSSDLNNLKYLLALGAYSLSNQAYTNALAVVGNTPSNGEQRQLETIAASLVVGENLLTSGDHVGAIDAFHEAIRRALNLL